MKLNNKTLRQLRRALRTQATELVKFLKEIFDGYLKDPWRWKSWAQHGPAVVHQLLQAAEVLDNAIKHGADTDGVANATLYRHSRKRRKRLHVVKPAPVFLRTPELCSDRQHRPAPASRSHGRG